MTPEEKLIHRYFQRIEYYFDLDREFPITLWDKLDYKFLCDDVILFTKKPQSLGYSISMGFKNVVHEKIVEALKLYGDADALSRYMETEGKKNNNKGLLESINHTHFIVYPKKDEEKAMKCLESHPLYQFFKFDKVTVPNWIDNDDMDLWIGWI